MQQYHDLVESVLTTGSYKPNRTGVDTISSFGQHYTIDVGAGYPLLTTKKMDGYRWNSMLHELIWYLSGDEHIRELQKETSIWDAWADDEGRLDTAYGRFWRRYPVPESGLEGESWVEDGHRWLNDDGTFDQIQYVIDTLRESPESRRMVVSAWHPANASVSTLPPCHYSFVFNVQGDSLNLHLTQRSADIALGVPFNIACYSLLLNIVAQRTGFNVGEFSHTLVDAHIYCGDDDRGLWYQENLEYVQSVLSDAETDDDYLYTRQLIDRLAPTELHDREGYDHVPNLLVQLSREPTDRPTIHIEDKPIDEIRVTDIELRNYESDEGLTFGVAE